MRTKKIFQMGKTKIMLTGGINKRGAYVYGGAKHQSGLSAGTSVGTKGHQVYASYNKGKSQVRLMKNLTTGKIKPRLRIR